MKFSVSLLLSLSVKITLETNKTQRFFSAVEHTTTFAAKIKIGDRLRKEVNKTKLKLYHIKKPLSGRQKQLQICERNIYAAIYFLFKFELVSGVILLSPLIKLN